MASPQPNQLRPSREYRVHGAPPQLVWVRSAWLAIQALRSADQVTSSESRRRGWRPAACRSLFIRPRIWVSIEAAVEAVEARAGWAPLSQAPTPARARTRTGRTALEP